MEYFINDTLYLCIDQGGHATRSIIFNHEGTLIASAFCDVETKHPEENIVEYDAEDILRSVRDSIQSVLKKIPSKKKYIVSAGLATQRSNVVCWHRLTGKALSPVISWQDRRNTDWLNSLNLDNESIHKKTGLFLSPHYGASKLRWCLDNLAEVKNAMDGGNLVMGPMSSFITFHLVKDNPLLVDPVNASRTQLWAVKQLDWDNELLQTFGIPADVLPSCVHSSHDFGVIDNQFIEDDISIPLKLVTGDQSAAMYTYGQLQPDTVYINTGTGAFLSRPSGPIALYGRRLLTSIIFHGEDLAHYVLEGTVNGAGSALEWLVQKYPDTNIYQHLPRWLDEVEQAPLFFNGISGLAAPFWSPTFPTQFSREASIDEQAVAIIESIAFLLKACLDEMAKLSSRPEQIQFTGGLSSLDGLIQRVSDLTGLAVYRPTECEATARGTAYLLAGSPHHWPEEEDGNWYEPEQNPGLLKRYQQWYEGTLSILRKPA